MRRNQESPRVSVTATVQTVKSTLPVDRYVTSHLVGKPHLRRQLHAPIETGATNQAVGCRGWRGGAGGGAGAGAGGVRRSAGHRGRVGGGGRPGARGDQPRRLELRAARQAAAAAAKGPRVLHRAPHRRGLLRGRGCSRPPMPQRGSSGSCSTRKATSSSMRCTASGIPRGAVALRVRPGRRPARCQRAGPPLQAREPAARVAREYLFQAYSVFTVASVDFSSHGREQGPRATRTASRSATPAIDNALEPEDLLPAACGLPLAPWSRSRSEYVGGHRHSLSL
jgi:hypothetical protein